jgi:hypothetical protein
VLASTVVLDNCDDLWFDIVGKTAEFNKPTNQLTGKITMNFVVSALFLGTKLVYYGSCELRNGEGEQKIGSEGCG